MSLTLDYLENIKIGSFNSIIFTIINKGYIDIGTNFIKRIKQLKMFKNMVFVCTDKVSYDFLKKECHIQCILQNIKSNICLELVEWKDKKYHQLVFNKFDVTKQMLEFALKNSVSRVLYIDTDMWFFRNFEQELFDMSIKTYPHADILMQDGENYQLHPIPVKFFFEGEQLISDRTSVRHCTGFMLIKPSEKVISIFDYKSCNDVDFKKFKGNQPFLNKILTKRLFIKVIDLNRKLGVNGSLFNDEEAIERLNTEEAKIAVASKEKSAWFLHYTYIFGKEKINKMKQFNHWII